MQNNHIIWSDINLDLEDWRSDLESEYPNAGDDELRSKMYEINDEYLGDERINLNIQLPREIIIIGDLGLWNGRFSGYKMIESGNIRDCLYSDCDMNEWFVDRNGDLRCKAIHHDGTNCYLYRTFKDNVSDYQIDNFKDKIYNRKATRADITRLTKRLGDDIGKVYGWDFPKKSKDNFFER